MNGKAQILQATETPHPRPKLSGTRKVSSEEYLRLMREMSAAVTAYDDAHEARKKGADLDEIHFRKLEKEMLGAMRAYNEAVRPPRLLLSLRSQA